MAGEKAVEGKTHSISQVCSYCRAFPSYQPAMAAGGPQRALQASHREEPRLGVRGGPQATPEAAVGEKGSPPPPEGPQPGAGISGSCPHLPCRGRADVPSGSSADREGKGHRWACLPVPPAAPGRETHTHGPSCPTWGRAVTGREGRPGPAPGQGPQPTAPVLISKA